MRTTLAVFATFLCSMLAQAADPYAVTTTTAGPDKLACITQLVTDLLNDSGDASLAGAVAIEVKRTGWWIFSDGWKFQLQATARGGKAGKGWIDATTRWDANQNTTTCRLEPRGCEDESSFFSKRDGVKLAIPYRDEYRCDTPGSSS